MTEHLKSILDAQLSAALASRAELHLYNLRHIQHHVGQLTACLRRVNVSTHWVGSRPVPPSFDD